MNLRKEKGRVSRNSCCILFIPFSLFY